MASFCTAVKEIAQESPGVGSPIRLSLFRDGEDRPT